MNTSGADASMAAGGVQINYVPRDGGNTFKGLLFFSGANSAMQGDQLLQRHPRRDGRLHAGRQPVLPRPGHAARSAEERLRLQPRLRRPDPQGQAVVLRHRALDGKPRTTCRTTTRTSNFVAGQTSPTLLNTDHAGLRARHQPGSADDARRRRLVLGADHASELADDAEEQVRHLLQQQEADDTNAVNNTAHESRATRLLLPVLRPAGAVVGAADQPPAARGRVLASPGNLGRQARAEATSSTRWRSASPTTTRRRTCPATCS